MDSIVFPVVMLNIVAMGAVAAVALGSAHPARGLDRLAGVEFKRVEPSGMTAEGAANVPAEGTMPLIDVKSTRINWAPNGKCTDISFADSGLPNGLTAAAIAGISSGGVVKVLQRVSQLVGTACPGVVKLHDWDSADAMVSTPVGIVKILIGYNAQRGVVIGVRSADIAVMRVVLNHISSLVVGQSAGLFGGMTGGGGGKVVVNITITAGPPKAAAAATAAAAAVAAVAAVAELIAPIFNNNTGLIIKII